MTQQRGLIPVVVLAACTATPLPSGEASSAEQATDTPEVAIPAASTFWAATPDGHVHIASGIPCPHELGAFTFTGAQDYPGIPNGEDVSCAYDSTEGGSLTLHITDFARKISPEAHLKSSATQIEQIFRQATPSPGPVLPNGQPLTRHAATYSISAPAADPSQAPTFTSVWIERIPPWHIKIRATYEADRAPAITTAASTLLNDARDALEPPTIF